MIRKQPLKDINVFPANSNGSGNGTRAWKKYNCRFIHVPIPWPWFQEAMLGGYEAICIGIAVWHFVSLNRTDRFTAAISDLCSITGLDPSQVHKGISDLKERDLLEIYDLDDDTADLEVIEWEEWIDN